MILEGRLKVRARVSGRTGLKALFVDHAEVIQAAGGPELSFAAAAIRMRLNARGLRKAIDGGFIEGVAPGATNVQATVAGAFAGQFMMMGRSVIASAGRLLNCGPG